MKLLLACLGGCCLAGMFMLSGCELVTPTSISRYQPNGTDLVMNEIYTLSPDKYYAFSWIELFNPTRKSIPWFSVSFPAEGSAVGAAGIGLSTTLDGEPWTTFNGGSSTDELRSITLPYADTILVAGASGANGIVYKVINDSANNRSSVPLASPPYPVNDIYFPQASRQGFCVTDNGGVYRSIDFGLSWQRQPRPTGFPNFSKKQRSLCFVDFSHIWSCGDSGSITKRIDVSHWSLAQIPTSYETTNLYSLFFSEDTGWAVGENGAILRSRDAGVTFLPMNSGVNVTLRSGFSGYTHAFAAYYQAGRAWVCGDNGVILRTDDGGTTWSRQNSQTAENLNKIVFVDSLKGWAFGDHGTAVWTTDGGSRWEVQQTPTTENLFGASFLFPTRTAVINYYELTMLAQKRHFFIDDATGQINPDFIVGVDTGYVHFIISGNNNVPVQGFTIINSDSSKFKNHFKLGPGQTNIINYSFGFDTVLFTPVRNPFTGVIVTYILPENAVLWNLLNSGELRLEKKHGLFSAITGDVLGLTTDVLDIVRYGDFKPPNDIFLNDHPLGYIPDGWSIARYANDFGLEDPKPDQLNSSYSFYMTNSPIPGWYSQQSRP